jgi:hypothetical protein
MAVDSQEWNNFFSLYQVEPIHCPSNGDLNGWRALIWSVLCEYAAPNTEIQNAWGSNSKSSVKRNFQGDPNEELCIVRVFNYMGFEDLTAVVMNCYITRDRSCLTLEIILFFTIIQKSLALYSPSL